jgi:Predicted acyltransferases
MPNSDKLYYLPEFEGLRGLMAIWVVLGHVANSLGVFYGGNIPVIMKMVVMTNIPVDVFIALSGFAISTLISREWLGYKQYMCGRFFRIYPVYIVLFLMSLALYMPHLNGVINSPVAPDSYVSAMRKMFDSYNEHTLVHIVSHLFLLHGLIPDSVVYGAGGSILGQAWSLSLEWQFYLIAPFILLVVNRKWFLIPLMLLICVFLSKMLSYYGLTFSYGAFLINKIWFFFFGISLSLLLSGQKRLAVLYLLGAFCGVFCVENVKGFLLSSCIWLMITSSILAYRGHLSFLRALATPFSSFMNAKFVQLLGRLSYIVYLSHVIVMDLVHRFIVANFGHLSFSFLNFIALSLVILITTLFVSYAIMIFIEQPFNNMGRAIRKGQFEWKSLRLRKA